MKKILLAGCDLEEQYRIKSYLENDYLIKSNPSVHNCIPSAREQNYDMILFDTENVTPLEHFMSELRQLNVNSPVAALTNISDLKQIQQFQKLGAVSIIKKPCNKKGLTDGISKGFLYYDRIQAKSIKNKPVYSLTKNESNILVCLKKHAILSYIREDSLGLILPTSLEIGSMILFRSPELYSKIGLTYQRPDRITLEIKKCTLVDDCQYKVEARFDLKGPDNQNFFNCLHRYIEQHVIQSNAAPNLRKILIAEADTFTRDFYQAALQNKGYQLIFATDGIQTLDILSEQKVDLLVMDFLLPRLNGQEVLDIMQKRNIKIPVIIATGENNPEIVQKVRPYIGDFILKPIKADRLSNGIAAAFSTWKETFSDSTVEKPTVQIQSDIDLMVAFQEQVKLLDLSENRLIFARHNPIAPGTKILMKTDAISTQKASSINRNAALELAVRSCKLHQDGQYFLVHATFNTNPKTLK